MQSKVKLNKRQIKEDKFTTFMLESKDQLQEHWQKVVVGLLAVIVLVVAVSYYFGSASQKEDQAAVRFANAMLDYQRGDNDVAVLGFTEIIDSYSGTQAAEDAMYMIGNLNFLQRKYDEAGRYFEMYLAEYKGDRFRRAAAQAGLAAIGEEQGSPAEAATLFEQAIAEDPDGPMAAEYHLSAVRNYLTAENMDKAREHLTVLEEKFEGSTYTRRAQLIISEKGLAAKS